MSRKVGILKALDQILTVYITKTQQEEIATWLAGVRAPKAWLEIASRAIPMVDDSVAAALRIILQEYLSRLPNITIPDGLQGKQLQAALVEELRTKMFNNNEPIIEAFEESLQGLDQVFIDAANVELAMISDSIASGAVGVVSNFDLDMVNNDAIEYMRHKAIITRDVMLKTNEAFITSTLATGISNGDTMDQMAKQLEEGWGFGQNRSYMIARTEVLSACNAGTYTGYKASGVVKGRQWVASMDSRTRKSHRLADLQQRVLGEPFNVGKYLMMYPGDGSLGAPAKEIIHCRCTTISILADTYQGD